MARDRTNAESFGVSGNQPSPGCGSPPIGEFRPGEEFAGYRIESLVGRGGMGVVYRATELSLGRPIALKVVAPALVDDTLARRRFVRGARAAAAIEHPSATSPRATSGAPQPPSAWRAAAAPR